MTIPIINSFYWPDSPYGWFSGVFNTSHQVFESNDVTIEITSFGLPYGKWNVIQKILIDVVVPIQYIKDIFISVSYLNLRNRLNSRLEMNNYVDCTKENMNSFTSYLLFREKGCAGFENLNVFQRWCHCSLAMFQYLPKSYLFGWIS